MTIYVQNGYTNSAALKALPTSQLGDFIDLIRLVGKRPLIDFTAPDKISNYKKTEAPYIIAGTMKPEANGGYHRTNAALQSRSVLIIDFDGMKDPQQLPNAAKKVLANIQHYYYPTISAGGVKVGHEDAGTYYGYRLAIATNRPFTQKEHKPLVKAVCNALGLEPDSATWTWSQLQGAPVETPNNQYAKYQGGNPKAPQKLDVDAWLKYEADTAKAKAKPAIKPVKFAHISDQIAEQAIKSWANLHADELKQESFFTSVIRFLIEAEKEGQISSKVVDEAGTILALGNDDWAAGNTQKIATQRREHLQQNALSFSQFFGVQIPADVHKFMSWDEMLNTLEDKASNWLNSLRDAAPTKKPNLLPDKPVAKVINETVPTFKHRIDDSTSLLYIYNPKTGVYDSSIQYARDLIYSIDEACSGTSQRTMAHVNEVIMTLTILAPEGDIERNERLSVLANGIYDIEANKLMPFSPAYRFETKAATAYKPDLKEPEIKQADGTIWKPSEWLNSLAQGDKQVVNLLWQIIADTVETNWSHEQAVILVGSKGRDGKSTFTSLLRNIAGADNTVAMGIQELDKRFSAYQLKGKTLLIGDDMDSGIYLEKSATFKSLASGDTVMADRKGLSPVTFNFTGAIVQGTNEMPKFSDKSGGIMRRLCLVPFTANFGGDGTAENKAIKKDYLKRPEVREWLMSQALSKHGDFDHYQMPDASKAMLDEFASDNDSVRAFINADDAQNIQGARIPTAWLYEKYSNWCAQNGYKRTNQRQFIKRFIEALSSNKVEAITTEEIQRLANGTRMSEVLPLGTMTAEQRKARPVATIDYFSDYEELGAGYDKLKEASGTVVIDKSRPYSCICFPAREKLLETVSQA